MSSEISRSAPESIKDEDGTAALPVERTISIPLEHDDEPTFEYPKFSILHETALIFVLLCSQIMTQAGVAQGNHIIRIVGEHFDVYDVGMLSWVVAAYSLTVGTFIIAAGKLGDIYGHERLYIVGYLWFALWSLLAGISRYSTYIFFLVCRGFQGIGPAILLPNTLAIIGRIYPQGKKRNMVFAMFGACAPSGYFFGAIFASIFAMFAHWTWAYYVTCIVCVALAIFGYYVIPIQPGGHRENKVDWMGAVTGISGLILFNVAWNQAPIVGWQRAYTYVLLVIGILLLAAFVYIELKIAEHPLVPLSAFNYETLIVLGCIVCGWGTFGIMVFYMMQFQQFVRGASPLMVSVYFIPAPICGVIASATCAFMFAKKVPVLLIMATAMISFLAGALLLCTLPLHQTYWSQTFVAFVVAAFGMDMSFPAGTIIFSNSVPHKHQGIGASLITTAVNYSISIALGFAGTVDKYTTNGGSSPEEFLKQTHHAGYLAVGLATLGTFLALSSYANERRKSKIGL